MHEKEKYKVLFLIPPLWEKSSAIVFEATILSTDSKIVNRIITSVVSAVTLKLFDIMLCLFCHRQLSTVNINPSVICSHFQPVVLQPYSLDALVLKCIVLSVAWNQTNITIFETKL